MNRSLDFDIAGIKKGPWTPEEDLILFAYIQEHGPGNWRSVPGNAGKLNYVYELLDRLKPLIDLWLFRVDAVQQELQAAVDELPEARNQARQFHRTGGQGYSASPSSAGE